MNAWILPISIYLFSGIFIIFITKSNKKIAIKLKNEILNDIPLWKKYLYKLIIILSSVIFWPFFITNWLIYRKIDDQITEDDIETQLIEIKKILLQNKNETKNIDHEKSINIAFNDLLGKSIEINIIKNKMVSGKYELFSNTTYELALLVAMAIFKDPNFTEKLQNIQMTARLKAIEWFEKNLINERLANNFEEDIYQLYNQHDSSLKMPSWLPGEVYVGIGSAEIQALQGDKYLKGFYYKNDNYLFGAARFYMDYAEAVKWYTKAADQGHARAQTYMGKFYSAGTFGAPDMHEAVEWYTKAALQGYAPAQDLLGWHYSTGQGIIQDKKKAAECYTKAAEQGYQDAQMHLDYMYGCMYLNGQDFDKDEKKAIELYTKAAQQGHLGAMFAIAEIYACGKGVDKDDRTAAEWYTKAAQQGHPGAMFAIAEIYAYGKGVDKDDRTAVEWYEKAAEEGDDDAQNNLGCMYLDGEGVDKDEKKALELFNKAAEQGNEIAMYNIGVMYQYGIGVDQDHDKSVIWYTRSSILGNKDSEKALEEIKL